MEVTVEAGSRLHLGLIDFGGKYGRIYGGMGVYLNKPKLLVTIKNSPSLNVSGKEGKRFTPYAERFLSHHGIKEGAEINVLEDIPAHAGLGSGTQTALSIGAGLARLYGIETTTEENASLFERGKISAVGTHLFNHGGFVLEGGHTIDSKKISPLLARYNFPKSWGFIIVTPKMEEGLSGLLEKKALKNTVGSTEKAEKTSHIILMKMLPALIEEDIESFGNALHEVDRTTGEHFKKIQGGEYGSEKTKKIVDFLLENGATGCGQSSWGPTVYGLTKESESRLLLNETTRFLAEENIEGNIFYADVRNRGASVRC